MKMFIKDFIDCFTRITTGITIVCALFLTLTEGVEHWEGLKYILWQVLAAAAVTALWTVLCIPCKMSEREVSKKEYFIRYAVHYFLINATIFIMGHEFGWFVLNLPSCIGMAISILMVYIFTAVSTYVSDKSYANEINDALKRFKDE